MHVMTAENVMRPVMISNMWTMLGREGCIHCLVLLLLGDTCNSIQGHVQNELKAKFIIN